MHHTNKTTTHTIQQHIHNTTNNQKTSKNEKKAGAYCCLVGLHIVMVMEKVVWKFVVLLYLLLLLVQVVQLVLFAKKIQ
jgi:hypothetical protein